ncbi:hypothetical protein ID866_9408 [Astraeus odoratus]|nr:hypothetical protein ID866_9408 [Astraeus odoratus]
MHASLRNAQKTLVDPKDMTH